MSIITIPVLHPLKWTEETNDNVLCVPKITTISRTHEEIEKMLALLIRGMFDFEEANGKSPNYVILNKETKQFIVQYLLSQQNSFHDYEKAREGKLFGMTILIGNVTKPVYAI